ncbi:4-hydroxy-tetrahydrodipicolinate reductase [bacterium]|nr:4-hydroxy-tetrahydrodipicolinate reductase [bacterium]
MIPVAVHGAEGRMGRLVAALVESADDCRLVGLVTEAGRGRPAGEFHPRLPLVEQPGMGEVLEPGCIIVDFSLAPALEGLLKGAGDLGSPLVIGTTGYTPDQKAALTGFAAVRPVVHAANFSIGIPALRMLLQLLARTLPASFAAEQVETHHAAKADKPSGTARQLSAAYREVRGGDEVPTHSLRLGGIVGEHTWTFSDQEETLVLTHRAHSRQAFLRGILPAVRFVNGRDRGLYDLQDVLMGSGGGA